jgi:hypothetical protein
MKIIALSGTSSTGKTTIFNLLRQYLPQYEFIDSINRTINNMGFPINELGTDLTQLAISTKNLSILTHEQSMVIDRGYLDLVAYSSNLNVQPQTMQLILDTWQDVKLRYTHIIYFPIEFELVDDGTRSINKEWHKAVDLSYQEILKNVQHLRVTGAVEQRLEQILNYIGAQHDLKSTTSNRTGYC